MKNHTIYYSKTFLEGDTIIIDDKSEISHITKSLRGKVGDLVEVSNGRGLKGSGSIVELGRKSIFVKIDSISLRSERGNNLTIALAILNKSSKMKLLVEKLTELGVSKIIPFRSEQTSFPNKSFENYSLSAISALKQSKAYFIPDIEEVISFEELITATDQYDSRFYCHFDGVSLGSIESSSNLLAVIGPEGGFTQNEIEKFDNCGFNRLSLGENVLKAETAAIAISARVLIK